MSHRTGQLDRQRPGGFTLIELLLAMGLFTVSIAMVATLFPAAIFQAKAADEHTMATIISENAVATIKSRLSHGRLQDRDPNAQRNQAVGTSFEPVTFGSTPQVSLADIDPNDAKYSHSPAVRDFGWVALVRQVVNGANDYQFVVVPYSVPKNNPPPAFTPATDQPPMEIDIEVIDGVPTATFDNDELTSFAIGSPVIRADNPLGRFAFIVGRMDQDTVILSNALGVTVAGSVPVNVRVLGTGGVDARSPAIGCFMFRTSLRANP